MRIIVGGESRKAGKTTLVCRLIATMPQFDWTAVKISGHAHGLQKAAFELNEESPQTAAGDTKRYLDAGARRVWWLRGDLESGLPALKALLGGARDWIVESTSAIGLIECDAALLVVAEGEVKDPARRTRERVDALVRFGGPAGESASRGTRLYGIEDPALIDFVRLCAESERDKDRIA